MSHIHVNFQEVRRDNKDINKLANKLNSIERDLDNIRFWISRKIKNRNGIEDRLDSAINSIDQLEKQLRTLYAFIEESIESYKNAEDKINALKLDGIEEKPWWENLGDIADVMGDSIKGFALGAKDAVVSTWDGLVHAVTHLDETIDGLAYVIQNPGEALSATWDAIVESWNTQVINGDAESRGKFFGRAFGEVALAVVGTKGVDKAVKAAKGTKLVQEASNGYKVVKSDVANKVGNMKVPVRVTQKVVVTPDGSKFSTWNVETKPARELYQKFTGKRDLVNVPRIEEITVKFNYKSKFDEAEFKRQLADQEAGINSLTVDEYLTNREKYISEGRTLEARMAQQVAREDAYLRKVNEFRDNGMTEDEALVQAKDWMDRQAALHNPDLVAGGNTTVSGVGDSKINSSLGSQWRWRIDEVDQHVKSLTASMTVEQKKTTYLSVKLQH